jgi:hypothetical protein
MFAATIAVIAIASWALSRSGAEQAGDPGSAHEATVSTVISAPGAGAAPVAPNGRAEALVQVNAAVVGAVVAPRAPAAAEIDAVGSTPAVRGDLNANLRSVAAAAKAGTNPERLTPLIAPEPFDAQRFAADPQAYLDLVEPGRAFQSAAPGVDVPTLELVGEAIPTMVQGGSTELRVRGAPAAPVTFTSFSCGAFANHLTSITVRADASGAASTTFTAPPGTLNDVSILAGSPLASGQVNFCVTVLPAIAITAGSR